MKAPLIKVVDKPKGNPKNGWAAVIAVSAVLLGVIANGIKQDKEDEKKAVEEATK